MSQEAKDKQASAAIATYMNLLKLSGSDTASVQPMFPTILATCRSGSSRVYGELAEMVSTAAATGPGFRKLMVEQNVPEFLVSLPLELFPTASQTAAASTHRQTTIIQWSNGLFTHVVAARNATDA